MEGNQIMAICLICLTAAIILIRFRRLSQKQKIKVLEKVLFSLVLDAEKQFGAKTGEAKYAAVVRMFYSSLPKRIIGFISPELIGYLIEQAVTEMKEYLKKNSEVQKITTS
jgi:hypothetical protein